MRCWMRCSHSVLVQEGSGLAWGREVRAGTLPWQQHSDGVRQDRGRRGEKPSREFFSPSLRLPPQGLIFTMPPMGNSVRCFN